jgi:hypothetical protein
VLGRLQDAVANLLRRFDLPLPIATLQRRSSSASCITNTVDSPGIHARRSPCRIRACGLLLFHRLL